MEADKMSSSFENEDCQETNKIEEYILPQKRKISVGQRSNPKKKKLKNFIKVNQEFEECIRKQMFRREWLENPEFRDWLEEGIFPYHGYCSVCKVSITAGKSELLTHSKGRKHLRNVQLHACKDSIIKDFTEIEDDSGTTRLLRIIDLRNDSVSVPSREMRYAMIEVESGDSSFFSDKPVTELEDMVARLLNKETGLLFPTHVMANLAAVLTHCQARGSSVIAGHDSDIHRSNREALVMFGGLQFCPVKEDCDGSLHLESVESMLKTMDIACPLTSLVCIECSHARKGGRVFTLDWIKKLGSICSSNNVLLHCDGTRLFNASMSQNLPPSRFVAACDSVTLTLDKGLGAPMGAVLVGSREFIRRASFIREFLGGRIHQGATFAAAGTHALNNSMATLDWDHEKAKAIAVAVARENSKLVSVDLNKVQTNIVLLHCKTESLNAVQLKERLSSVNEERNSCIAENAIILGEAINWTTFSLMVHNKITHDDIRTINKKLSSIIREIGGNAKT